MKLIIGCAQLTSGDDQKANGPAAITAELDLQALQEIRTRFPALNHRRPDLFPGG